MGHQEIPKKGIDKHNKMCYNLKAEWMKPLAIVGIDCHEGPPVPIPNTEGKVMCADDSCRVTGRENR